MKYLKTFEGHGRVELSEDGKQAICGPVGLPQSWNWEDEQKPGFDPNSLVLPPDNCYNYLWDENDHLDQKDIDRMMSPHMRKGNEFGFNPMNEMRHLASPKNDGDERIYFIKKEIEDIKYILKDEGVIIDYNTHPIKLMGFLFSFKLIYPKVDGIPFKKWSEEVEDICSEFIDRADEICKKHGYTIKESSKKENIRTYRDKVYNVVKIKKK